MLVALGLSLAMAGLSVRARRKEKEAKALADRKKILDIAREIRTKKFRDKIEDLTRRQELGGMKVRTPRNSTVIANFAAPRRNPADDTINLMASALLASEISTYDSSSGTSSDTSGTDGSGGGRDF